MQLDYEIPKEWTDVFKMINNIGKSLREDAVSKSFSPKAEYSKMLNILTGCYMYLVPLYKQYRAIKENNAVAKYCEIKNETTTKFISAAAEKEASNFVCKERFYRDLLESWMLASEQGIYTLKKHLDSDTKEEDLS